MIYSLKEGMVYQLFGDIPCLLFVFFINLHSIEKHDMMKNTLFYCLLFCWIFSGRALLAQSVHGYCPLDKAHPDYFYGDRIRYAGTEIKLDKKTFFIDGQLSDETVSRYPFVFNSFNEAAKAFVAGTEAEPMRVYIAPYVYWLDNPDDPQV